MAGSLKRVPESKDVAYCCFIGVMPAEGMIYQQVFTVALVWRSIITRCDASNSHTSPGREGRSWQARCTDWENKLGSDLRLDIPVFRGGPIHRDGFCRRVAKSLIDLHRDQLEQLPLLRRHFEVY